MKMPVLVVAGDKGASDKFSARLDWRADAYSGPAPKALLTVYGGEHMLGGISGYDAAETTDEEPQRVADVEWLTWSYLRTGLYPEDPAWNTALGELRASLSARSTASEPSLMQSRPHAKRSSE
jgi:hypothetical protein